MTFVEMRRWTTADAGALYSAFVGSPDLARQLGGASLQDVEACAAFIETRLAAPSASSYQFAVAVDGVAVGNVGVSAVERAHGTAWMSYWIEARVRRQGLATRGLSTAARWAVDELGLFRLELGHRTENPASCAVATRSGFRPEGVERSKLRYGTERFDVETHARLATDPEPDVALLPLA
jgi:RimJ/RimL family protein N-acetyltransferase